MKASAPDTCCCCCCYNFNLLQFLPRALAPNHGPDDDLCRMTPMTCNGDVRRTAGCHSNQPTQPAATILQHYNCCSVLAHVTVLAYLHNL
jgi:hypothetical protein